MNPSYWLETTTPKFPTLSQDRRVDACIVGGGIAGLTAAYLLAKAGRSVAILEKDRFGALYTGHTTAHLTLVTDMRLSDLVSDFGRDHAQAVWDAGRAAIEQIHSTIHAEKIDCSFVWVPGYLHVPTDSSDTDQERKSLEEDTRLANELGFDASVVNAVPLMGSPGIRFPNQARFHPLEYVKGLLKALAQTNAVLFENCEVSEMSDSPLTVRANGHTVSCDYLILATHVPMSGKAGFLSSTVFQSKLSLYSTYAIAARVPSGRVPDAMFWDTNDPYRYLRLDQRTDGTYLIYGGEDHKTGQVSETNPQFENLERSLMRLVPEAKPTHRWSGQVVEPFDGLPFIGENAERQFIATGFSGNGMTFGTIAGVMACDAVLGRKNPWKNLFDPHRKSISGAWDYLKENVDYPYYMIRDRLASAEGESLDTLKPGEGKILKLNREKVAAYRDTAGVVTTLTPVCPHMGCHVHWNTSESTWDCPCHGSRFQPTGELLAGPAESPLERVDPANSK
jgi:glycine/D-amino acid oxidase-like deaminating enzyme/nitrite reductase/ring-hydroxylating ferredoxin subunit